MRKKTVFAILFLLLGIGGFLAYKVFGPATRTPSGEFFYVKTGSDYTSVKNDLVEQGYLQNTTWFNIVSKMLKYRRIHPGRYKVRKNMSVFKLVRMLRNGQQTPVSFVITKLRTKENLASRMARSFEFDSLQAIHFLNSNDSLKAFGLDTSTVMAAAMPYTYSLKWNNTPGNVFREFVKAYDRFWTEERKAKADRKGLTPVQAITLASIVEEETRKKEDKYNIASTYLNRLDKNMRLQADPTIKFALKDFTLKRITGVHLRVSSPYNTYQNTGLPPGPICTPSIESIEAVLGAPETDYLYFVASSKFDGSSVFTTNYEDHMKYARLYQQELTRRMDSSAKARAQQP
jgi:UPF0755 protein